ncbi:hypothetical protein NQL31_000243 [Lotmaria passim]
MSRPNQRLDTDDDATAYRVARLLRQSTHPNVCDVSTNSLRSMTSQIEQFLSAAPKVPAVRMEPEWTAVAAGGHHDEEDSEAEVQERDGQPVVVQLNVVAGVLQAEKEESDVASGGGGMSCLDGILLPTAENQQELHRRKVRQAQAMLNLMSALSVHTEADGLGVGQASPHGSTRLLQHSSSSNSDDDEVAVMDADDLNDEDTSDEELPAKRQRITEMS